MKKRFYCLTAFIVSLFIILTCLLSGCVSNGDSTENISGTQSSITNDAVKSAQVYATVDSIVDSVINSSDFDSGTEQEKVSALMHTLQSLEKRGLVEENSIEYNEKEKIIVFKYSDGGDGIISFKEFDENINASLHNKKDSTNEYNPELYEVNLDDLTAIVLNAFEDTPYRRDYYSELKKDWDALGLSTSIDTSTTVDELKLLEKFDVVVFAGHGTIINGSPVFCLNQTVTRETDEVFSGDIIEHCIGRVRFVGEDGPDYIVYPKFFSKYYKFDDGLKTKLFFSESCEFFGDDSQSKDPDYVFANTIDSVTQGAIIGYHNSVGANYSRDIMKYTIETALNGVNFDKALELAKEKYGDDDNWEDISDGKYIAYPIITGNTKATLVDIPVSDFSLPNDTVLTIGELNVLEPVVTPDNATGYSLKWTSSDSNIVSVSPTGEKGILTAKSKGTATITAELTSGGQTITKTTNVRVASKGRDTVLVLDVSGSMGGTPLDEMKESAINFCEELLKDEYNNRVGLVFYSTDVNTVDLTNDLNMLEDYIDGTDATSMTNMEGGLSAASDMLDRLGKKDNIKNIVIMADGLPNEGKTSSSGSMQYSSYYGWNTDVEYASAVIDTAKSVRSKYNLYSLGFFHSLYGEEKNFATTLMKSLVANDKDYYQVDEAENLQFVFGDIEQTISDGSKIIINIACPVDVNVSYNGETLSSAEVSYSDKASFGTLQLLGKNKDVKVLSLDPNIDYDVKLYGTDTGTMDYSVNYLDDQENMIDFRSFESVPITPKTIITTDTNNKGEDVSLNIDDDGDGTVDSVWSATEKSSGKIVSQQEETTEPVTEPVTEPAEPQEETGNSTVVIIVVSIILLAAILTVVIVLAVRSGGKKDELKPATKSTNKPAEITPKPKAAPEAAAAVKNPKAEKPRGKHTITVTSGSLKGVSFPIKDFETIKIGKDASQSNIVIPKEYKNVSRLHCSISYNPNIDKFVVIDFSSNGVYYADGTRFEAKKSVNVSKGQTIMLANENCKLYLS